jgi:hypothetical protein
MANTFYYDACNVNSKMTPFPVKTESIELDNGLMFYNAKDSANGQLLMPHSIMNENVAINYRNIYNGYPLYSTESDFTEYSDYTRCMSKNQFYASYLTDKKNPTYKNILNYYNSEDFDPYGLAKYRMQDFIYLKYYNQIPNNYMITLRRYTRPCEDHMFGLDMSPSFVNQMNGYPDDYFALATAVTYMGEKTGNKLSDILKFEYGANWEEKEGKVEALQNPDGGLAAQLKNRLGVTDDSIAGRAGVSVSNTMQIAKWVTAVMGKGVNINEAMASQYDADTFTFSNRYGEEFYGDVNVVNRVKMRSRGLTYSNNFSLTFEYSLKSLKCVNPRIAMMDILSNFLILTGNYGMFWGGATIFYGNRSIAPQYGDPTLLRQGKYGEHLKSVLGDVKEGFNRITEKDITGGGLKGFFTGVKNLISGGLAALAGNLFGGNIGIAGEAQVPAALLSGAPSGFWHVTVGNPLDPIAMMGNMAVTKTSVEFGDALGYDDFPTEIKFTVDLEHCRPRDNAGIEAMFNAGKGRFYAFTDSDLYHAYHNIDSMQNFDQESNKSMVEQERNTGFDRTTGMEKGVNTGHGTVTSNIIKTIGGFLND